MLLFSIFLQGFNYVFTYLYFGNSLQNDNTPAPTKINNNKTTITNAGKHAPPELIKEHLLQQAIDINTVVNIGNTQTLMVTDTFSKEEYPEVYKVMAKLFTDRGLLPTTKKRNFF